MKIKIQKLISCILNKLMSERRQTKKDRLLRLEKEISEIRQRQMFCEKLNDSLKKMEEESREIEQEPDDEQVSLREAIPIGPQYPQRPSRLPPLPPRPSIGVEDVSFELQDRQGPPPPSLLMQEQTIFPPPQIQPPPEFSELPIRLVDESEIPSVEQKQLECRNDKDIYFNNIEHPPSFNVSIISETEKKHYQRMCFKPSELPFYWLHPNEIYYEWVSCSVNDQPQCMVPILTKPFFELPHLGIKIDSEGYKNVLIYNSLFVKYVGKILVGKIENQPPQEEDIFTLVPIHRETVSGNFKISEGEISKFEPTQGDLNYFLSRNPFS